MNTNARTLTKSVREIRPEDLDALVDSLNRSNNGRRPTDVELLCLSDRAERAAVSYGVLELLLAGKLDVRRNGAAMGYEFARRGRQWES